MPVRARLYDATGTDQEVTLNARIIADLHDKQMLWIDVTDSEEAELRQVISLLGLNRESAFALLQRDRRPRLDNYGNYFQCNVRALQETEGAYQRIDLDFVLGCNFVLTAHRDTVEFLESFDRRIKGDSQLGELDAPAFLASLLDWHITSYFRIIERLEARIDTIDARALRAHHRRDLLAELAKLQRRVAHVRRALTPHREVYAAMARPDFLVLARSESAVHFASLNDRLERAIEAVENTRELLVGSFNIFTTQITLRTNEAIKTLTLASFLWFPASVIIGIAGLLLKTPVYPIGKTGFWLMFVFIGLIGAGAMALARWRRWI